MYKRRIEKRARERKKEKHFKKINLKKETRK